MRRRGDRGPAASRSFVLALAAAGWCACSAAPATTEQAALEQRRLLQPYVDGGEIGCGELLVELTRNFYPNVAQPTVDVNIHGAHKEQGNGYVDTVWINKIGDLRGAFTVTIGETNQFTEQGIVRGRETKFTVLHELRVRVFGDGHALALDATAKGKPLVLKSKGQVRDLAEFQVRDGALRMQ